MKGLLTLKDISIQKIYDIFSLASDFKSGKRVDYSNRKIATLFFENSTRTQYSFLKDNKF